MLYLIDTRRLCTSETKEHQACSNRVESGWLLSKHWKVRGTKGRWVALEAFPKDSELACGVACRVASCVAGVPGHRLWRYGQAGRMKRTLRVIAVLVAGVQQTLTR
jgi:hypothetical protein